VDIKGIADKKRSRGEPLCLNVPVCVCVCVLPVYCTFHRTVLSFLVWCHNLRSTLCTRKEPSNHRFDIL